MSRVRRWRWFLAGMALAAAVPALAASYDPAPWLADLRQMRGVFDTKYANLDWLSGERGTDVDALFEDTAGRVRRADSDAAARAAFDLLIRRIDDGHVALDWPRVAAAATTSAAMPLCASLGFDARQSAAGVSAALPGYRALPADGNVFPAGTLAVGKRTVGALRIGVFQPQGSPALCEAAVKALAIPAGQPCNPACSDAIVSWAYARFNRDFAERLRQLRAAKVSALLVDIADNGGGSEWAEAAARMVSGRPIRSARLGFVRGSHWADAWRNRAADLRKAARTATPADRPRLEAWALQADAARAEAERDCARGGCARLATAGYATGLVGDASAGTFAGKDWAPLLFDIAQFDYRDGEWSGPLVVLVDQETWSAAEEFAALLQDNRAAIVIGARTGGAGCGHTNGGTPTVLTNSGATFEVPDCVRFRRDGSNEVRGVIPDVLTGIRVNDGAAFKASLIAAKLPEAIEQAARLAGR